MCVDLFAAVEQGAAVAPGDADMLQTSPVRCGFSLLHAAVLCGRAPLVRRLADRAPALLTSTDARGRTPADLCWSPDVADALGVVRAPASAAAALDGLCGGPLQRTLVHWGAITGAVDVVASALAARPDDVFQPDALGVTPLRYALMRKDRRVFDLLWTESVLAANVVGVPKRFSVPARPLRVVVVGAGAAGLAAARYLSAAGVADIEVVEARDRLGGRAFAKALPGSERPIDLGGSWIHGSGPHNPVTRYADALGIVSQRGFMGGGTALFDEGGAEIGGKAMVAAQQQASRILRRSQELGLLCESDPTVPDMSVMESVAELYAEIQGRNNARGRRLLDWCLARTEQVEAAPLTALSLMHWDKGADFNGPDKLVPGGYGSLITSLELGLRVSLGERVVGIRRRGAGAVVETDRRKLECDAVVVTAPLGVLKSGAIAFEPALPADTQAAIDAMGVGLMNKVVLEFDRPFWRSRDKDAYTIGYVSQEKGRFPFWIDYSRMCHPEGRHVLMCFLTCAFAHKAEAMADTELRDAALAQLRTMYPRQQINLVSFSATRWGADPLALGSYSHYAIGSGPATSEALAAPVWDGSLFLAGEAAAPDHIGTIHGGYISGLRAAAGLLQAAEEGDEDMPMPSL